MLIGAHESASGGPHRALERAYTDGCESVAMFVKNQHRWEQRAWTDEEVERFRAHDAEHPIDVVAHAAYLINLCSPTADVVDKSIAGLADELARCEQLGVPSLVFHPGAPGAKASEVDGVAGIGAGLDRLFDEHGDTFPSVTLLLENTAGQGSNLGWRFEHLRDILGATKHAARLGVCYDTCHAFAAGYEFGTRELYDAHWAEFHAVVGLPRLQAFHINDSKRECGSRVDRHDHPGEGLIGIDPFVWLMNDPRFQNIPAILETPPLGDDGGYSTNIERMVALRSMTNG